jgi:hypothetical protein
MGLQLHLLLLDESLILHNEPCGYHMLGKTWRVTAPTELPEVMESAVAAAGISKGDSTTAVTLWR